MNYINIIICVISYYLIYVWVSFPNIYCTAYIIIVVGGSTRVFGIKKNTSSGSIVKPIKISPWYIIQVLHQHNHIHYI